MDGKFDNLQELIYVESHLSNTATKFYGELTQQMLKLSDAPGSDNGTGFFQTLCALKVCFVWSSLVMPPSHQPAYTRRTPSHLISPASIIRSVRSTRRSPANPWLLLPWESKCGE